MKMLPRQKLNRIFENVTFGFMAYGTRFEIGVFVSYNCWNRIYSKFTTDVPRLQLFRAIIPDRRRRM